MADGAVVRLRRHGSANSRVRIALSHGNGLAVDAYAPFWSLLVDRYDVVVFDMRNHGQNPLHGARGHDWTTFAEDLEGIWRGIREHFGAKPTVGAFHSLSAIASLLHVLERGRRWDALVLFDPPLFPGPGHPLEAVEAEHMREMARRARWRPERYRDPRLLAAQFAARPEFRRWLPGVHELLAGATLRREPETGEWTLACPRELEARIFETNVDASIWPRLPTLETPLKLICGDPTLEGQLPPALIGKALGDELGIEYEFVPGTTHFLQVEKPQACLQAMARFLVRHDLGGGGEASG